LFGDRCVEGAPDLVIEVLSPSTRDLDLPGGRKFAIYERYGVPYYWIVDPDADVIHQYTWANGRYDPPALLHSGDTLSCPLFADVTVPVAAVFAALV
jgi:Uma2 family endonuclease